MEHGATIIDSHFLRLKMLAVGGMGNKPQKGYPASIMNCDADQEQEVMKQQGSSVVTMKSTPSYCLLCLDDAPNMLDRNLFCKASDTPDGSSCCLECLIGYVSSATTSAFKGTIPALNCPLCPPCKEKGEGNRCLLNFCALVKLADQNSELANILKQYDDLASSVGTMQCGDCHCRKSIHIKSSESDISIAKSQFGDDLPRVTNVIESFDSGEIGVELFFEQVSTVLFPHLNTLSDKEAWNSVIKNVLRLIVNPERRVNFQLRYLRNRPRVWSPCHNREQCFKCKTKNYHEGKTCAQMCDQYSNDVCSCPQCGVFLVKGDGCDSVQCVCGKYFSFNSLLTGQRNARQFAEEFPLKTSSMCARVLCQSSGDCQQHDPSLSTARLQLIAKAWSKESPIETERALLQWWRQKYPQYTAQCSVAPLPHQAAEGIVRARRLYRTLHAAQVSAAEMQIKVARASIMDTFYPSPRDKERLLVRKLLDKASAATIADSCFLMRGGGGHAQVAALNKLVTDNMTAALIAWKNDKRHDMLIGNEETMVKSAGEIRSQQFLFLFGQLPLRLYSSDPDPNNNNYDNNPKGVPVTVGRKSETIQKPEHIIDVGDEIEVVPLRSSYLEGRRGHIIATSNDGTLFDVELKTTIRIVLHNLPRHRINNNTPGNRPHQVFMLPSLAMSEEQMSMFTSFIKHIEKHSTLPALPAAEKREREVEVEMEPGEGGRARGLRQFLDIALNRAVLYREATGAGAGVGVGVDDGVVLEADAAAATATWHDLYDSVRPFLK